MAGTLLGALWGKTVIVSMRAAPWGTIVLIGDISGFLLCRRRGNMTALRLSVRLRDPRIALGISMRCDAMEETISTPILPLMPVCQSFFLVILRDKAHELFNTPEKILRSTPVVEHHVGASGFFGDVHLVRKTA